MRNSSLRTWTQLNIILLLVGNLKIHPPLKCPGFDLSGSPVIEDDGYSEIDARFEAHVSRGEHEETEQPNGTVDVEEE